MRKSVEGNILPLLPLIGEDGSQSFFNTKYNEAYHSKIGPITEAIHKFIEPLCIEEFLLNKSRIKILDLFFGLGYNTGIFLDTAYKITDLPIVEITAIEQDIEIIKQIKNLVVPKWYLRWKELFMKLESKNSILQKVECENVKITLHLENIFNMTDKLTKNYFDIILFDPFSHKVSPEFWSDSFLNFVFKLLAKGGKLSTYSGLKRVEKLAIELGYRTKRITPIGRKKNSLLICAF